MTTTTRAKRRKLEDFTCFDLQSYCWDGCDGFYDCDIGAAYREYLALQRCARLLGMFERYLGSLVEGVARSMGSWMAYHTFAGGKASLIAADRLFRFRCYIRSALREAGL